MQFPNERVEQLRQGTWSVDCVEMTLAQHATSSPKTYEGPGHFRQREDGTVVYKVYAEPHKTIDIYELFFNGAVLGRLIARDKYYRLEGLDLRETRWQVRQTIPDPSVSEIDGVNHQIVEGVADEVGFTRPCEKADLYALTMVFFTDVEVPGNAITEVTTVFAGERTYRSGERNIAKFSTRFGDFLIHNRPGMIVVEVSSRTRFPPDFEIRIVEALGLVLAKPLYWNVIERYDENTETVRMRGKRVSIAAKVPPPFGRGMQQVNGSSVWRLFDGYLTMVCAYLGQGFHPCSRHLFAVLEASAGGYVATALALGVAVEGIVKELFPDAGKDPTNLRPTVKRLRKYFRDWPEFKDDAQTKAALYDRVETMLGRILDVSTKSKLYALAKDKVIDESHIKAWSDLRNAAAHGVTPGSEDIQTLVDLCNKVTVLMYHLAFRAAGYEGRYVDYGTHNYPPKYYRGRLFTEDEVASVAYVLWEKSNREHGHDREHWLKAKELMEQGWM